MTTSKTQTALICYRYDGEDQSIIIDVTGNSREEMIADGKRQAREILEEGIRFSIDLD